MIKVTQTALAPTLHIKEVLWGSADLQRGSQDAAESKPVVSGYVSLSCESSAFGLQGERGQATLGQGMVEDCNASTPTWVG